MKRVYRAANLLEAELVKDQLGDAGIPAVVHGALLTGIMGEIPVDATPEVWIEDPRDYPRACALIAAYEQRLRQPSHGHWRCPNCGEEVELPLEICWNCNAPRGEDD